MTQPKIYNEKKAKRALAYSNVLQHRIKEIEAHTKLERLRKESKDIMSAHVQVCCPQCKQAHLVSISDYQAGKYRSICYTCFEKNQRAISSRIYDKVKKEFPERNVYFSNLERVDRIEIVVSKEEYNKPRRW